jgi:2-oxo-4-hydroxy-4-carboxy-5-ureidoimidazoline decarboxylase
MPITLAELNDMDRAAFVVVLGDIFEHAQWIVEAGHARRPFASVTALHDAMLSVVAASPPDEVTRFLNNHPDLAGPTAGAPAMTAHSTAEQNGAGLGSLTMAEVARLAEWNARYRDKFEFPFIICVRRHSKESIFAKFERRLAREPAVERHTALAEIARITALRLVEKVSGPGMPRVHGTLSTHLLDASRGLPAARVPIELVAFSPDGSTRLVVETVSNEDGRTDLPLIAGRPIPIGCYELRFSLGQHFARYAATKGPPFLDTIPVRFTVTEPEAHYHIPLLVTPWSYSTYRGS